MKKEVLHQTLVRVPVEVNKDDTVKAENEVRARIVEVIHAALKEFSPSFVEPRYWVIKDSGGLEIIEVELEGPTIHYSSVETGYQCTNGGAWIIIHSIEHLRSTERNDLNIEGAEIIRRYYGPSTVLLDRVKTAVAQKVVGLADIEFTGDEIKGIVHAMGQGVFIM